VVVSLPILVLLVVLLALSAAFSATEAALLSVNKVRLRHLVEQGHRGAQLTYETLTHLDRAIGTLLIGNNLVNVAISAIGSWIFVSLFGPEEGLVLATVGVTALLLIAGEVTPKMFAATHADIVIFAPLGRTNIPEAEQRRIERRRVSPLAAADARPVSAGELCDRRRAPAAAAAAGPREAPLAARHGRRAQGDDSNGPGGRHTR
jgi:hypothetical protein